MKLEHLIQGYNFNKIPAKINQEINKDNENAGVIKFNEDIYASYLLDEKGFVEAINLFSNCVTARASKINIDSQIEHTINTLTIIQKTIELLGNTKKEEVNSILNQLEFFSGQLKKKAVRFLDYIYKIEPMDGILMFSIIKENEGEK